MSKLKLVEVTKSYSTKEGPLPVLEQISLEVRGNQFVSLVGPSGCGKSTLFNIICGLVKQDSGSILLEGEEKTKPGDLISYMPQKDLLLPWRRVIDNVILPLKLAGVSTADAVREAMGLMDVFGLKGFERRYPWELSGGMRQRAALMRTVLAKKDILLLDEPFGALDAITRFKMQSWLLQVWHRFKRTVLFITHDVEEAVYLSDKIYVLSQRPGRIKLEVDVPLARPRIPGMITGAHFVKIKEKILKSIDA
ncbi:ABC-type nitrate/sulfonate/bicarbonate transport system ATPase subunit [Desulfohalotomaculum tongense]|uniref:ABC transporter ATP-binding protein n=1 Tax=Desulforadius tongensis TaxID=1216062 RepID=UPI00195CB7D9|nr:ABC transporter ATP-binding protein [Desulforadius tongensis]MBM7855540.1 ABC-type nitrate/sulfonate/bicarbonate transport system ATPase subunit [Desulforadius tongensis]